MRSKVQASIPSIVSSLENDLGLKKSLIGDAEI